MKTEGYGSIYENFLMLRHKITTVIWRVRLISASALRLVNRLEIDKIFENDIIALFVAIELLFIYNYKYYM